jgi:hypothetical protein
VRRFPAAALVAVPLLVVGWLTAHDVAYHLVWPQSEARTRALESAGHGYLAYAPLAVAVCLSAALIAAGVRLAGRHARSVPPAAAALPLLGFCVQELLERALAGDPAWWSAAAEPVFLLGLLLQLPLAAAALVVAAALTRAADAVRERSRRPAGAARVASRLPAARPVFLPAQRVLAACAAGRAPPARL